MNIKALVGILVGIVLICFTIGFLSLKHYNYELSSIRGLDIGSNSISIDADGSHVKIGAGGIYVQDGKDSVKIGPGGINIRDASSNNSLKIGPRFSWGLFGRKFTTKNLIERNIDEEKTEGIDGIECIYICTSFVDINIIPHEKDKIKIHYNGYIKASSIPKLEIDRSGNTLYISTDTDKPSNAFDPDLKLDIYIPSTFKEHLEVSTTSGDIEVRDIEIKSLQTHSSSGDIDILNSSIDSISIDSTSGNQTVQSLASTEGNFSSSSGDINILKSNIDSLSIGSTSGDQTAESLTYIKGNFGSSSGDIILILPKNSEFNLKATTSSGNISSDFPIAITSKNRFELAGRVGDSSNSITISTSSGDINIKSK